MTTWQDIASAPKDGTKIDLLYPHPRGRLVDCCWHLECWMGRLPAWRDGKLLPDDEWDFVTHPNMEPTHWMLPPNPRRAHDLHRTP